MTALHRIARWSSLAAGALLAVIGVVLRWSPHTRATHHGMTGMTGMPRGSPQSTATLIGSLLLLEGALLLLTGLVVLRPASRRSPPAEHPIDHSRSPIPEGGPMDNFDVEVAQVVTIGGGLGSFALIDRLRIAGVASHEIRVVSTTTDPTLRFAELCRWSGMLPGDRLRSDSSARMDNIWGFPGYAAAEAAEQRSARPLLRTMLEPLWAEPYAPTLQLLLDGVRREAERIRWTEMVTHGEAYRVTALPSGDYLVLVHREGQPDLAIQTGWVHLALGSPGPVVSDAVTAYREQHDTDRVAHTYEPHEEVYQGLRRRGGDVLVRGSGIASSRVLERIIDDRDRSGREVHIWQLFETYHAAPTGPITRRHDAGHGYHYQTDSFPKAAFGGQIRDEIRRLDEPDRLEQIQRLGAPSTPYRSRWARQLRRGRAQGWYDAVVGELDEVRPRAAGLTASILLANRERLDLDVDSVIDATDTCTAAERHPLVRGLVEEELAQLNALGGLRVDEDFVVNRSVAGGIVASGMTAAGAPLAPVDSFLGLQSAALSIARTLAESGIGEPLTPLRSLRSWWHWMEGAAV